MKKNTTKTNKTHRSVTQSRKTIVCDSKYEDQIDLRQIYKRVHRELSKRKIEGDNTG